MDMSIGNLKPNELNYGTPQLRLHTLNIYNWISFKRIPLNSKFKMEKRKKNAFVVVKMKKKTLRLFCYVLF